TCVTTSPEVNSASAYYYPRGQAAASAGYSKGLFAAGWRRDEDRHIEEAAIGRRGRDLRLPHLYALRMDAVGLQLLGMTTPAHLGYDFVRREVAATEAEHLDEPAAGQRQQ